MFVLDGPSPSSSDDLRTHLLRPWTLYLRLFPNHDAAAHWATSPPDPAGHASPPAQPQPPSPPPFLPSQGFFLSTFFAGEEAVVDLSDPASISKFFVQLSAHQCADGVPVAGLALDITPITVPPPVLVDPRSTNVRSRPRPTNIHGDRPQDPKRRRLMTTTPAVSGVRGGRSVAERAAEATPISVAAWTGAVGGRTFLPGHALAAAAPRRAPTSSGGQRHGAGTSPGRRRIAWSYGGAGGDSSRSQRVATLPLRVELPATVVGAERKVCRLLVGNESVFLTGPPGCGKTHLVNEVVSTLRAVGLTVSVCGSSGVAAALVGGTTVHAWTGFINGDADVVSPLETVLAKVIPSSAKFRMRSTMVLVIDEVGTLSAALITRLDVVLRAVRRCSLPFGGLLVLFSGDFLQLAPPVGNFAFLSDAWREVFGNRAIVLDTHWRHISDRRLLDVLLRMRVGLHTNEDMELLATRRSAKPPPTAVWLFCHSMPAKDKNEEELHRLPGPDVTYHAQDKVKVTYLTLEGARNLLDDGLKFLRVLTLRVGALVLVPSNCLAGDGVPSGSRGVVLCFFWVGCMRYPTVRFELPTGGFKTVDIMPVTASVVALDGVEKAATRTQLPLVLSWAMTIHGAQGWTLPEAAVDLSKAWAAGQALSGLSRTPSLAGLHLVGFDEEKVIVDGVAVSFHDSLVPY